MGQPVVHWEFWSKDPQRIGRFYEEVFGWNTSAIPEVNYHVVQTNSTGGINGGMMTPQDGEWPAKLAFYVAVQDLDEFSAKIRSAGGTMLVEKQPVPGMGELSLFSDPDGRVLGMWQAAGSQKA